MNSHTNRKTQNQMFLLVSRGHICAPEKDTNRGVSISLLCSRPMHLLSYTEGLERLRPISDKKLHFFQYIVAFNIALQFGWL